MDRSKHTGTIGCVALPLALFASFLPGCGGEVPTPSDLDLETREAAASRNPASLSEAPWALGDGVNFDALRTADFDGDGVIDKVHCNSTEFVKIERSGGGAWTFTPQMTRSGGVVRKVTRCAIVEIVPGFPSVVVSSFWWTPAETRWRANQHVIFNKDGSRPTRHDVAVSGSAYLTVGRAVTCTPYPQQLVDAGYNPGALCFFAGYHGDAAMIKLEAQAGDGSLVAKDITPHSGLLWRAGVNWAPHNDTRTWYSYFPHADYCTHQPDGYFTIDSAMLDFDEDGLMDMVVVGQHASVRAYRMVLDTSRTGSEGVTYTMSYINNAKHGGMTEYIRADAFNELEPHLGSTCVYLAGEYDGCQITKDHLRCYEGGSWRKVDLPRTLRSTYRGATIRANGKGKVLIRTRDDSPSENVQFAYDFVGPLEGEVTSVHGTHATASKIRLKGWACRKNDDAAMKIIVRSKPIGDASATVYASEAPALDSPAEIQARCLQPGAVQRNFDIRLDKRAMPGGNHDLYVYAKSATRGGRKLLRTIKVVTPASVRSRHSGKCLAVRDGSTASGADVVQVNCSGTSERQWHLEPLGGGEYLVRNAKSGKCLDVKNWSTSPGGRLAQWSCHRKANQRWRKESRAGGFQLRSVHSGLCADVAGWSTQSNARIIQWTCHGGANQIWL